MLKRLSLSYALGDPTRGAPNHPLSVAPEMTAIGLMFALTAATIALGLPRWLTRSRIRQIAGVITALGGLIALIGIVQRATTPGLIYGFWQPYIGTDPFGPFVNKNHFAGWTIMGLPVALGLAAGLFARRRRHRAKDWRERIVRLSATENTGALLAIFAAMVMTLGLLFSLSRSGIVAGGAALVVAIVMTARRQGWIAGAIATSIVIALALIAVRASDTDRLAYRFQSVGEATYASRLVIWQDTARMIRDVPFVGVGIGAYTVASIVYQTGLPDEHVGAAHSDWLQLAAEGGLLVGIPGTIVLLVLIGEALKRFREHRIKRDVGTTYWIRAGAATGIFAVSLQSLVEFSLQMPGNTVLFALLWAIVIAPAPMPEASMNSSSGGPQVA